MLNLQPMVVAAGAWHAAVVGWDGRVCRWGRGRYSCLGHGNEECENHIGMAKPKDGCTLPFGCGKPRYIQGELVPGRGCLIYHRKGIEQSIFKVIFLKLVTQENTTVTDEGSIAG
ncbi:putative E3 ubiquitin-protein ligase HERC1-like protein [Trifolium pratense]|nr:putative E3 ubiquitin-protein ligase HERC1-like protein [Trifolium pratense]